MERPYPAILNLGWVFWVLHWDCGTPSTTKMKVQRTRDKRCSTQGICPASRLGGMEVLLALLLGYTSGWFGKGLLVYGGLQR
jgi:hypothetical protein